MVSWVKDILAGDRSFLAQLGHDDWERFLTFARKHGVAPVLYLSLKNLPDSSCLEHLNELRSIYRTEAQNGLLLFNGLGKVLKALDEAKIPVIVLKGACLAEAVYGNIALRSMSDVDLLVKKDDLEKTVQVLKCCGYAGSYDFQVEKEIAVSVNHHLPPLVGPDKLQLEIHWTLFDYTYFEARDQDEEQVVETWQRAQPAAIESAPCLMLAPEDLFLHLCIHLSRQHVFNMRMRHLLDLRKVCERYGGAFDWEVMYQRARQWQVDRSVLLTVALAERLIGLAIPERMKRILKTEGPDPNILEWVEERILMESPDLKLPRFAARNSLREKAGVLLRQFFPTPAVLARRYFLGLNPADLKIYLSYPKHWYLLGKQGGRIVRSILKDRATIVPSLQKEEALRRWLAQT